MRVGVVVRLDAKGLGYLTRDVAVMLRPSRVLGVRVPAQEAAGYPPLAGAAPGADIVTFDGSLDERACRWWLRGLDAVWTAETPYDPRFFAWAREEGVRSVCMVMPEFFHWADPGRGPAAPDEFWAPTCWWVDRLPPGTPVVPPPAPAREARRRTEAATFVHVAGTGAAGDRNGTGAVLAAARMLREPQRLVVRSQAPLAHRLPWTRPGVELVAEQGGKGDRWEMYADADVLVLPRRYAGLSLPIVEACADGMAVIGTDREPERSTWPMLRVARARASSMRLGGATVRLSRPTFVECENPDPEALAAAMDSLVRQPDAVADLSAASAAWAEANSADALRPVWEARLGALVA